MKIKLESISEKGFQVGHNIEYLTKGQIVEANFSEFGIKLLFGDVWTREYRYRDIEKQFKVCGQ